jgi:hypothetical protein
MGGTPSSASIFGLGNSSQNAAPGNSTLAALRLALYQKTFRVKSSNFTNRIVTKDFLNRIGSSCSSSIDKLAVHVLTDNPNKTRLVQSQLVLRSNRGFRISSAHE